jgi:hypothetical protein
MAHRSRGQERLGFAVSSQTASSLDDLSRLIDWDQIAGIGEHRMLVAACGDEGQHRF